MFTLENTEEPNNFFLSSNSTQCNLVFTLPNLHKFGNNAIETLHLKQIKTTVKLKASVANQN